MTILELAHQAGLNPKWAASTKGGEYHSSCPVCGGNDRFYIQPHRQMNKCLGYYCCRQCETCGDAIQFAREFLNFSFQEACDTVEANITEKSLPSQSQSFYSSLPAVLKRPPEKWIVNASDFVSHAHKQLLQKKDVLALLAERGLPIEAVRNYKLGWSRKNEFFVREHWGIEEQLDQNGQPRKLWIPGGLVIPTIAFNGDVMRLKVRRYNWKEGDNLPKYVAISGSMNGLNLIGDCYKNKVMVVVESELDAYAIDFLAHDFAFAVAVGSNVKNPDNITDRCARNSSHLLILYDNDVGGIKMVQKWKKLYPHAQGHTVPQGKDVGEFIKQGGNIRTFIEKIVRCKFLHNEEIL